MRFVIILTLFFSLCFSKPVYDFWDSSSNTNEKNTVKIKNTNYSNSDSLRKNDTIRPNIAKDFNKKNIGKSKDLEKQSVKDKYLKYNLAGQKDPQIADDFNPDKIKLAPDYGDYKKPKKRKIRKRVVQRKQKKNTSKKDLEENLQEKNTYQNNQVVFYDENSREDSFIDLIPFISIGNSLFVISNSGYEARILDDSLSASMTVDLGLNYIWPNRNIGYLWNINLGNYDFSGKDKKSSNSQSKGSISGIVLSVMPTIFYQLNRDQTMSVMLAYGLGTSYVRLKGDATLENNNNQTLEDNIAINQFVFSHGLLIEVLHKNVMVSFTKVNMKMDEKGQKIKLYENRLNIGYKFSF